MSKCITGTEGMEEPEGIEKFNYTEKEWEERLLEARKYKGNGRYPKDSLSNHKYGESNNASLKNLKKHTHNHLKMK